MKKNNKVNPLTHFNNTKAAAIKKAGGEMSAYKKSLKKFQGDVTGSQVSSDPASMASSDVRRSMSSMNAMGTNINEDNRKKMFDEGSLNPNKLLREASERNRLFDNMQTRNNQAAQATMMQKKGGSVKRKRK